MSRNTEGPVVETLYGNLDREALKQLRGRYDTMALLKIIDELDELVQVACGEDGIRDTLLRLHSMAHTVINGAQISVSADGETLPELAAWLTSELYSAVAAMQKWIRRIEPLEKLAADE